MTQTKNTSNTIVAEEILNHLHLKYRRIVFSDGSLYFCTLESGLTFDLFLGVDASVRLWRFVNSVPISEAGVHVEYREPKYPHTSIGFEVTEDGDLCFYAEQFTNHDDPRCKKRIQRMIQGYCALICSADFRNITM